MTSFFKVKMYRSLKFLKFVRTLKCWVDKVPGEDVDPCHLTTGGVSLKGDDRIVCPLRNKFHQELHHIGRTEFEKKHNVNLDDGARYAMMEYIAYLELKDGDSKT